MNTTTTKTIHFKILVCQQHLKHSRMQKRRKRRKHKTFEKINIFQHSGCTKLKYKYHTIVKHYKATIWKLSAFELRNNFVHCLMDFLYMRTLNAYIFLIFNSFNLFNSSVVFSFLSFLELSSANECFIFYKPNIFKLIIFK